MVRARARQGRGAQCDVAAGDAAEEDIDEEVQKVLHEVAGDAVAAMPQAGKGTVAAQEAAKTEEVRTPTTP